MRGSLPALVALACAGLLTPAAAAARTSFGQCPEGEPGTTCEIRTGKVTFVGDGDTISVDLDGDGTKSPVHVRMTGINTPEESVHTDRATDRLGECHANEAAGRLESLLKAGRNKVRLAAQDPSSHSRGRLKREVSVRIRSKWRDVGRVMIREGHALWMSGSAEWAWNRAYSTLAQQAAARQVGIWDPDYCGFGPPANLKIWANANPEGARDVDGEWIRIRNLDPVNPVSLAGWRVRDSGLRGYVLPSSATLAPGAELTVWVGEGGDAPPDYYWQLRTSIFDNVRDERASGDGAYLIDPDGDVRAAMQYPCRYACSDPLTNAVAVEPHPTGREWVVLRNVSAAPVDLEGYRLATGSHSYAFGPDSVMQPGEELRVDLRGDPADDVHGQKYWGLSSYVLGNGGGRMVLSSMAYVRVGCAAWGTGSC